MTRKSVNLTRNVTQSWVNLTTLFCQVCRKLTNFRVIFDPEWSLAPEWTLFRVTLTRVFLECMHDITKQKQHKHSTYMSVIISVSCPGGYLVGFFRKSRIEMEGESFNIKAGIDKFVADGLWTRLPDETNLTFFTVDVGVSSDPGVIVTMRKN